MREQLIKLAKEKGFEMFIDNFENQIDNSIIYYLILCELQKWLRDKQDVFVCIESGYDKMLGYNRGFILNINGKSHHKDNDVYIYYEEALEQGCFEALGYDIEIVSEK